MATGIDSLSINNLQVDLLSSIESINALSERLDSCKTIIQASIDGTGKSEIIGKLDTIMEQIPNVNVIINSYISILGKVVSHYKEEDQTLASNVIQNISKLGQ